MSSFVDGLVPELVIGAEIEHWPLSPLVIIQHSSACHCFKRWHLGNGMMLTTWLHLELLLLIAPALVCIPSAFNHEEQPTGEKVDGELEVESIVD